MKTQAENDSIVSSFLDCLNAKAFPCISAKTAVAKSHVGCLVADHMACPKDDMAVLHFLYDFIDTYRCTDGIFYSAAIIFKEPIALTEIEFDTLMWKRLQALSDLDAKNYSYDKRVDPDPHSSNFSFSIKEEAFFIIGMHAASIRAARQFIYPTLVFNPHAQFEKLKQNDKYESLKNVTRKRDIAYSGSVNPMLDDFGKSSEARQYSGRMYNDQWKCPFIVKPIQK